MVPKQCVVKEVTTSVTAAPPPTIECPIAGKSFSPFLKDFFFISIEAKIWPFHGESTAIHQDLVNSGSHFDSIKF